MRLAEALEQQAATAEILRVISRSRTDVQPVFDTIAAAALKLFGASSANVYTFRRQVDPFGRPRKSRKVPTPFANPSRGRRVGRPGLPGPC